MTPARRYADASNAYRPSRIRTLFICESPPFAADPNRPSYFFFENCPGTDILFATIVKAIYDIDYRKDPERKRELLNRMKQDGYWLMDAVEEPINRDASGNIGKRRREEAIQRNIPSLLQRLSEFRASGELGDETGIILIKRNVWDLVSAPLRDAGYNVLNQGKIDFPKYYRDRDTVAGVRALLKSGRMA